MGEMIDLPPTQSPACPRVKARSVWGILPAKYYQALEQNQLLASCCRHPEDHDIEALYSSDADREKGQPDIYIFHCTCGRQHRRFCVGGSKGFKVDHMGEFVRDASGAVIPDEQLRPFWSVR